MGSRAAVAVANNLHGSPLYDFVKGVVCLAYPLHPSGNTEALGDEPLRALRIPCFMVSGTADSMCHRELLERILPVSDIECVETDGETLQV